MNEALLLFDSVRNSTWFVNSAHVLFFTKIDCFREKIASGKSPISKYFPDYNGQPTDIDAAQEFFASKFRSVSERDKKELQIHYINNLDAGSIKEAFGTLQI